MQSAPLGCTRMLGSAAQGPGYRNPHHPRENPKPTDPGTLLETHRKQTRLVLAGLGSPVKKGLNRNLAAVRSAELLDDVVKRPRSAQACRGLDSALTEGGATL